ncbi:hypothetical protein CFOL_v3_05609 [Cephalotus follicularis]|uniref:tRNA ligase phosphodiesterase domain-containing protein n=1 Tax=Cephalotus follicularis TaxID=3775 RepID=A0A1Q3B2G8_CEPFO|nr:hypothetical protein CFOL_v3_05609 [Cephalotus follicularis]
MSASQRIICTLALNLSLPSSSTITTFNKSSYFLLLRSSSYKTLARSLSFTDSSSISPSIMPRNKRSGGYRERSWKEKPMVNNSSPEGASATVAETITHRFRELDVIERIRQSHVPESSLQYGSIILANPVPAQGQKAIMKPKPYGTVSGATGAEVDNATVNKTAVATQGTASETESAQKGSVSLSKIFKGNLLENFTVDNSTYSLAQIRATFYPKFENEKTDQEIRTRMIEMVSKGLVTLEVSLKHSGSLFMYAGQEGGAYAKNSFGNIYTAVGVFVLGRMLREAWGTEAAKKEAELNNFLDMNRMCISMELVTAVLGDHGQRPREDYVVVTAVTELGHGKPKFYSTPEVITFCRKWRLPTNHVWLFSTRKSVTSFFAAYDALYEEGTATPVCRALDEVADISITGSKDHIKVQGEILEGLVARIVSRESSKHMEEVLRDYPPPPAEGVGLDLGRSLREICANMSNEKQKIKALLQGAGSSFCPDDADWFGNESEDAHSKNADKSVLSKFLQSHPADYSTTKLQEMIRLIKDSSKRFPVAFKFYHNFHKVNSVSSDKLFYKMVIHVLSDSAFQRYQKEMRQKPGLWPLYRGFFVDINLFKTNKERVAEKGKSNNNIVGIFNGSGDASVVDGLADDDANLMIKLKFLTYKLRTFLIRNGLPILFKNGPDDYRDYCRRQMEKWQTSAGKQEELRNMLDEWAVYIKGKCGKEQPSSATYLTEAEPFLEQYAKRRPQNQILIGAAGNLVRAEDFLAIVGGRNEESDIEKEMEVAPISPISSFKETVHKDKGWIVFFPGIPGCAKSALCKELLNAPGGLDDDRPVHSLMGDLIKGRYWQKVGDELRSKPYSIMLADKNAPNEEVWKQIEDMCRNMRAMAVPVVPDSEGTDSNPFSLDALAVFMFRVLQRVNHPGNLDKASPNAGYVLLMFYHLYEGKNRKEFENELVERFGSLVKMPLLKEDRSPLPDAVNLVLEEGMNLYKLHTVRHRRLDSTKGAYAKEWAKWEKQLRDALLSNAEYLNSIQVPFEIAVKQVMEQLRSVVKGAYMAPGVEKRKSGTIVFAAVNLPVTEIQSLLDDLGRKNPKVQAFLRDKNLNKNLKKAHVTLAHKKSHGVAAVAGYSMFLNQKVAVEVTALLFTDKVAAFETQLGSIDGEQIVVRNEWPHITIWTGEGVAAKEANMLPQLLSEGKATLIEVNPPIIISGIVQLY